MAILTKAIIGQHAGDPRRGGSGRRQAAGDLDGGGGAQRGKQLSPLIDVSLSLPFDQLRYCRRRVVSAPPKCCQQHYPNGDLLTVIPGYTNHDMKSCTYLYAIIVPSQCLSLAHLT